VPYGRSDFGSLRHFEAAMIGFTNVWPGSRNLGVTVNAIAAGIFDTDLAQTLPERLFGRCTTSGVSRPPRPSNRIGEYAAFMVSDATAFMNARVVIVDGGAIT